MSFQLAYIELQVTNDVYEIAEKHLDKGSLSSYYKTDKFLWTGTLDLGTPFEVEVKIKGGQVLSTTCDCKDYSQKSPCVHITTLLIQLRRDLSKEIVAPIKPKSPQNNRIKISKLIELSSKEELSTFIQQYARKNKGFSNELKAFLSSSMSDIVDNDYYSQLILSAMRINRKKDKSISVKGASHIKTIIEELWLQSQDKFASKKYTEATAILKALVVQLPIIIDKVTDKIYFANLFKKAILSFNSFPQNLVSPELADDVFSFLNSELSINIIMTNQLGKIYFDTLLELATTLDKKSILKGTITEAKRHASKWSKKNYISLILIELKLAQQEGDKEQKNDLIHKHLTHPDILFHVIQEAELESNWAQVREFAEIGIEQKFNPSLNKTLYKHLYKEATVSKEDQRIQKYAEALFLSTYELHYLEKLLQRTKDKDREAYLQDLLIKIHSTPFHVHKKEAVAEIYLQLEDQDTLFEYIAKIKSLDLLQSVTERLVPEKKKQLTKLYITLIKDYLDFHLGPVPILKVKKTLMHLRKIGAHDMVHKISDALALEFSERSALLGELEIL